MKKEYLYSPLIELEKKFESDNEVDKIKEKLNDFDELSLKEIKEINNRLLELKQ